MPKKLKRFLTWLDKTHEASCIELIIFAAIFASAAVFYSWLFWGYYNEANPETRLDLLVSAALGVSIFIALSLFGLVFPKAIKAIKARRDKCIMPGSAP